MRVLVVGLGSIGQRHVRNLRALMGDAVEILACRWRGLPHVITERMTLDASRTVETALGIRSFRSLEDALGERPHAVLVCNPSSLHVPTALAAARAGCHVFIEKPLSDRIEHVDTLRAEVERQGIVAAVGYQLRFHPALNRVQALLAAGAIGRPHSVLAEFRESLPDAHPYEDYRAGYAARADLGGGVILCYIHEFDYLTWWFGLPERLMTTGGRLGSLEIDVEDSASTTMWYSSGLIVQLEQSFLAPGGASRRCAIHGDRGTITLDLNAPSVTLAADGRDECETFPGFSRNQLFLDELARFLDATRGLHAPMVSLDEGERSLRVALAARLSLASGRESTIA